MPSLVSELVRHKLVVSAMGVVALIFVGSIAYYAIESKPPALTYVPVTEGAIRETVTAHGSVTALQNPELSFAVGGRVAAVNVKVGDAVTAGQLLANLDVGVLGANLAAAQANYAGLTAPPRAVDLAGKQTAVAQAETTLQNEYAALPSALSSALANAEDAVHVTDPLFSSLNATNYPHLGFSTRNQTIAETAGQERGTLDDAFPDWTHALDSLEGTTATAALDAALAGEVDNLVQVRAFFDSFVQAMNAASPALPAATVSGVAAARATVNSTIASLEAEQQTLANDALAVESAKDALDLAVAGATPETVAAAAAQVHAASAQLGQAEIIAPFSGTVASVAVKAGDIASPNAPAISLLPAGSFEVDVYLSEIDAAKITAGNAAEVTLDAYGTGKVFTAKVASVDRASTVVNGVPAYKATLVFDTPDASIAAGQGANVVIHVGEKDTALLVPKGAVVTKNNQTYVLKASAQGPLETPVIAGLVGATTTEIISGVAAGDEVARVAGQ